MKAEIKSMFNIILRGEDDMYGIRPLTKNSIISNMHFKTVKNGLNIVKYYDITFYTDEKISDDVVGSLERRIYPHEFDNLDNFIDKFEKMMKEVEKSIKFLAKAFKEKQNQLFLFGEVNT